MSQKQTSVPRHLTNPSMPIFILLHNYLTSIPNDKPLKQIKNDLLSMSAKKPPDAEKYILTYLMEISQISQIKDKVNIPLKTTLLIQMIKQLANSEHFLSYFPEIVIKVTKQNKTNQYINNLMNNLKLPLSVQITIALSLYLSDRPQFMSIGQNQLILRLKEYQHSDKTIKLSEKLLDQLLFQIHMNPQLSNKLNSEIKTLLQAIQKINKNSESKIFSYFREEWQFFTNDNILVDKPPNIVLKKCDILKDFGPSFSHQIQNIKAIVSQVGSLNEEEIFQCLMMMTQERSKHDCHADRFVTQLMYLSSNLTTKKNVKNSQQLKTFFNQQFNKSAYDGKIISWNIENFLLYCNQNIQNIKWQNVFSNFDRQNLIFSSDEHFVQIMRVFEKIRKFSKKFSVTDSILYKKWPHPESQAQFLLNLFTCKQPQCLFFLNNQPPQKKVSNHSKDTTSTRQVWASQDLVSLLFQVSSYKRQKIKQLFQIAISRYPDTLIKTLSLVQSTDGMNMIQQVFLKVLPQFLQTDSKSVNIIQYIWQHNQELLIITLNQLQNYENRKYFNIDYEKLVQIFQQIPGSIDEILRQSYQYFQVPFAIVAGKVQVFNFEKWLIAKIQKNQPQFFKQLVSILQNNLFKQLRSATQADQKQNILQQSGFNIQILNKIFTILIDRLKKQNSSKYFQVFKKLHKQCCVAFPEVAEGHISQQVQRQCQQQIKKIYRQQISIKDAVQQLKRLKISPKKQQRQQFVNRITILCIQLTYHHSYPQKQLMITADLFSSLINENLIQKKIFQVVLHVLDQYLKQNDKKFTFALRVMQAIKQKLSHESWFCQKLIDNDLIMKKDPQLVQKIIKSIEPPKILSVEKQRKLKDAIRKKNAPQQIPKRMIIQPKTHHQPVIIKPEITEFDILSTLDKTKKIDISDREAKIRAITTICNTLSISNVQQKAKELKKFLDNQKVVKLFSYYLIFKRLTQNNSIKIYAKLIQLIPKLERPMMNITYKVLQSWFNLTGKSINDKKFANFKNIAAWLGKMTIGKSIPVPIYKLNIKDILVKSYVNNNRLNFNVPVVLKILQFIKQHPHIFRPQSPWLRRIMCTLIEIQSNLKQDQQVKNQIKAFFKQVQINIQTFLSNQPSLLSNDSQFTFTQLCQIVSITQEITKMCEFFEIQNIRALVGRAIDLAVQQIVEPVMERTIRIAKTTTKQMIVKDFSTQTNSQKVRESSLILAKQLAGPLAQITSREPLKVKMQNHLRQSICQSMQTKIKPQQLQQLVQKIAIQNVDIGCNIIKQKVAKFTQRSLKQDYQLTGDLQMRNLLKKQGQSFKNEQFLNNIPSVVPRQLKPNSSGITDQQYNVYLEFKKIKSKQITLKQDQINDESAYENIVDLIQQKQSVQKIKKVLQNQQIHQQQILNKLFLCMLDQNNDELQQNYYLQVCQILRQAIDPKVCWKVFKQVGNFKNKSSQRLIGKLVRARFFQENALKQIFYQQEKAINYFQKWIKQVPTKSSISNFISVLHKEIGTQQGNTRMFFFSCIKYIIGKINQQNSQNQVQFSILYVEQLVKLITCYYATVQSEKQQIQQIIQSIIEGLVKYQHKSPTGANHQRVFFKIIINLLSEFNSEKDIDSTLPQQKMQFFHCSLCRQLIKINPSLKPGFAFAWLQVVYNKHLIKNILDKYQNWQLYFNLLCCLLKFMKQNVTVVKLKNNTYGHVYQRYYEAVLRLIIVLIHDFSSFLSQFSLQLCLLVDSSFVQLKNMILSSIPTKSQDFPLKFDKSEQLQKLVQKGGYPKYYKLTFDKSKLNHYLLGDYSKDVQLKQKLSQQQDIFLQTFVLYVGWHAENGLSSNESTSKLTQIISNSRQELKSKLVNCVINLIRYPQYITSFFIQFARNSIFKQNKDNQLRQLMLANIITRMTGEVPIAWGLIYFGKEIIQRKKQLQELKISKELLDQL